MFLLFKTICWSLVDRTCLTFYFVAFLDDVHVYSHFPLIVRLNPLSRRKYVKSCAYPICFILSGGVNFQAFFVPVLTSNSTHLINLLIFTIVLIPKLDVSVNPFACPRCINTQSCSILNLRNRFVEMLRFVHVNEEMNEAEFHLTVRSSQFKNSIWKLDNLSIRQSNLSIKILNYHCCGNILMFIGWLISWL